MGKRHEMGGRQTNKQVSVPRDGPAIPFLNKIHKDIPMCCGIAAGNITAAVAIRLMDMLCKFQSFMAFYQQADTRPYWIYS